MIFIKLAPSRAALLPTTAEIKLRPMLGRVHKHSADQVFQSLVAGSGFLQGRVQEFLEAVKRGTVAGIGQCPLVGEIVIERGVLKVKGSRNLGHRRQRITLGINGLYRRTHDRLSLAGRLAATRYRLWFLYFGSCHGLGKSL